MSVLVDTHQKYYPGQNVLTRDDDIALIIKAIWKTENPSYMGWYYWVIWENEDQEMYGEDTLHQDDLNPTEKTWSVAEAILKLQGLLSNIDPKSSDAFNHREILNYLLKIIKD